MGLPKEKREQGTENLSEKMTENSPNLVKEVDIQVQAMQGDPNKMNPKRPTLRHIIIKMPKVALAGVAQWIEYMPVNERVASSIPSQGTCLGCRLGQVPRRGVREATIH